MASSFMKNLFDSIKNNATSKSKSIDFVFIHLSQFISISKKMFFDFAFYEKQYKLTSQTE